MKMLIALLSTFSATQALAADSLSGTWRPASCHCAGGTDLSPDVCDTNRDARLHVQVDGPGSARYSWTWTVYTQAFGRCDAEYGGSLAIEGNRLGFAAAAARCVNKNDGNSEGIPPNHQLFRLSGDELTLISETSWRCPNGRFEKVLVRE